MSAPQVTYGEGRFVLAPDTLTALATLSADGPDATDPDHLAVLRDAEVVDAAGGIVAELELVARAVAEPVCALVVDLDAERLHGWVSPEMVVLLAPHAGDDDRVEVMAGPTTHLPLLLTELTGLGPRPVDHADAVVELDEDGLPGLLVADPEQLAAAPDADGTEDPHVAGALASLVETYRRRWYVQTRWGSGATSGWRVVEALDSEAGWWSVERADGRAQLAATNATELYRALTALLPSKDELGVGS